ncbi:hypothetical protein BDW62DRAFT_209583 [Aspergillus aurantiobrunneus]
MVNAKSFKPYYIFTILIIVTGGIPKGYDEGGFSASVELDSFKENFELLPKLWKDNSSGLADRKANISLFGVLGAAFGSLLALVLTDRIGRLRSWQVFIVLWASGVFIGTIVSIYMVILLSFLTIGFFINFGVKSGMEFGPAQYRLQVRIKEQILGDASTWTIFKEIATCASYRKRFLLGVLMQTVAQWSGGNGITYYIQGSTAIIPLITSGVYGVVKLVFTMAFTWGLVDVTGRRHCMLTGIGLQCITHVYLSIYISIFQDGQNKPASNAAIASVFIYAIGWSVGLCTVQYLYGTEIFPTRIRSVCYATNMALHWFFQFAIVRVTPNMFDSLDTKGIPMEKMEELFSGRWWMGWKAKVDLSETQGTDVKKPGVAEIEKV